MKKILKNMVVTIIIILGVLSWVYFSFRVYQAKTHHLTWPRYLSSYTHRKMTAGDVAYIAPWMTFDYISKIFNLPPVYLQQTLQIDDSRYPQLTISQYAKKIKTSPTLLTQNIQVNVKEYLASSTTQ